MNDLLYLEECITTNKPNKKSAISPVIIVSIIKIPTIIPIVPAALEPLFARRYPINKNTANPIGNIKANIKVVKGSSHKKNEQ